MEFDIYESSHDFTNFSKMGLTQIRVTGSANDLECWRSHFIILDMLGFLKIVDTSRVYSHGSEFQMFFQFQLLKKDISLVQFLENNPD